MSPSPFHPLGSFIGEPGLLTFFIRLERQFGGVWGRKRTLTLLREAGKYRDFRGLMDWKSVLTKDPEPEGLL